MMKALKKLDKHYILFLVIAFSMLYFPVSAPFSAAQADCSDQPTPRLNINSVAIVQTQTPLSLFPTPDFPRAFNELYSGTLVRVLDKPQCHEERYMIHISGAGKIGWAAELAPDGSYQLVSIDAELPTDQLFVGQTDINTPDVSFTYDLALGRRVLVQRKDADQIVITFLDYPNQRILQPNSIVIFPTDHYTGSFPSVATELLPQILTIIEERPSLANTTEELPVLPVFTSAQEFVSRANYFEGQSLIGFSFITRYTQNLVPLVGDELRYVVQAIADDGELYLYAFMQIQTQTPLPLPDFEETVGILDMEEMGAAYQNYLQLGTEMIATFPSDAFIPPIDVLNSVFTSLEVKISRDELPFAITENFLCDGLLPTFARGATHTSTVEQIWDTPNAEASTILIDSTQPLTLIDPYCVNGNTTWWQAQQGDIVGWIPAEYLQP